MTVNILERFSQLGYDFLSKLVPRVMIWRTNPSLYFWRVIQHQTPFNRDAPSEWVAKAAKQCQTEEFYSGTIRLRRSDIIKTTITSFTNSKSLRATLLVEHQLQDTHFAWLRALRRALHDALKILFMTHFYMYDNIPQLCAIMRPIRHRHRHVAMILGNGVPMFAARY